MNNIDTVGYFAYEVTHFVFKVNKRFFQLAYNADERENRNELGSYRCRNEASPQL